MNELREITPISEIAPFRLGKGGIEKLCRISEDIAFKIKPHRSSSLAIVAGKAEECMRIMLHKARTGDEVAARASHAFVEWATSAFNSIADPELPLWQKILSSSNGWPVVYSDTVDEKKRTKGILKHVGSSSIMNIVHHHRPCTKPPRYTQEDMLTEISMQLGGDLLHLQGIAKNLTIDFPSNRKFTRRLDTLLSFAPNEVPTNGIRSMVEKFRGSPGFSPRAQLADWVVIWLEIETGGHLELISELRRKCVTVKAAEEGGEKLKKLMRKQAAAVSSEHYRHALAFLRNNIGTPATECCIRATIAARLRSTNSWINRFHFTPDIP